MSKIVIWSSNFNNNTCRKNSNILFIFGDNVKRKGYAGQAIIRDEKNSFGIPTCKSPNVFFTDKELNYNKDIIDQSLKKLKKKIDTYDYIAFPINGIGTGLSMLKTRSPKTWEYLNSELYKHFNIVNKSYEQ